MLFLRKDSMTTTTLFYRQMAAMISSGVSVDDALTTLGLLNENIEVEKLVTTIQKDIKAGDTPGKSLTKYPDFFKKVLQHFHSIEKNESEFSEILYSIADDNEKMEDMKNRVNAILFYPFAIISIALFITGIILVFVIPTFVELFSSFGGALPGPTQIVVTLSNFIFDYVGLIILSIIVTVVLLVVNKNIAHRLLNAIPGIGEFVKNMVIIRFLKYLSLLLTLKVPPGEAIEYASDSVDNIVYANRLKLLKTSISETSQISRALEDSGLFPPMILRMINAGEKAGSIEKSLSEIAGYYEKKLSSVEKYIQILDLAIMIFIGTVIGGLVISMYLPIFQMGGALS